MLLLLLALQQPLSAQPDTLKPVQDAVDYDFTLVLPDTGNHLLGQVQTRWMLTSTRPIEVQLDTAMRVVRVLMNGIPDARLARSLYARDQGMVVIPHERAPGDTLTTAIRYLGSPRAGLVFGTDPSGQPAVFADNWPDHAHYWIPVQDVPGDKATASFHIEVPEGYQAIANGTLAARRYAAPGTDGLALPDRRADTGLHHGGRSRAIRRHHPAGRRLRCALRADGALDLPGRLGLGGAGPLPPGGRDRELLQQR